ncbi:MAG: hypothetical protein B7Z55_09765, partial [Planctomycetales bacterium 12-60-4]
AAWLAIFTAMAVAPVVSLALLSSLEFVVPQSGPDAEFSGIISRATNELERSLVGGEVSSDDIAQLFVGRDGVEAADEEVTMDSWHSWSASSQRWTHAVVALWLTGMLVTSLRLVGAAAWMWCVMRRLEPAGNATVQSARRLARHLGLRRLPRIAISSSVSEPLALQWFRPLVLLPASWLADVPPGVLEAVLAHELAHIRRHDLWVNLAQRVVETLLFFHPCVWWVSKQIRIERELCCDADAVRATGQPVAYAQALEIAARRRWARVSPPLAVGLGGTRMALLHRVKQVLGVESSAAESNWWTLGLAGIGVSAACWTGATLWSAPAQGDDTAEAFAFADEEELRPAPPRREAEVDRPPRREGDGERPPRGEGRDGEPRPPRDGEPRPPRDGERGPRGPEREGRPEPRPPHEIVEELMNVFRHLDERGEEGRRQKQEIMEHLMHALHEGGPRGEGRRPDGPHPEGERPRGEPGPRGPEHEAMQDMMHAVRELQAEVERLRAEMHEMRGQRPPGPPPFMRERFEGDREGPPRGPRDGEAGPPRGARDGDGPPRGGPRDGEAGPPRGPRDGEAGPPRGPRDGEDAPRRGPRD